ncbi:MAG: glycosyltransferase, partial [Chloroflexaceae bacterium]|nr:glycosyltransferase [Chloroflexaceae bacterium]
MNIMFLIRNLEYGGAERQLVTLAKGLYAAGYRVMVVAMTGGGPLQTDLRTGGVPVRDLYRSGKGDIGSIIRLIHLIRTYQPDVIHSYLQTANLMAVLLKPLFPHIRIVWGIRASFMDWSKYGRFAQVLYTIECFLSRFANLIITNSAAAQAYAIAQGFPAHKLVVITNGIDTDRFVINRAAGQPLRATWGVSNEQHLIGLVGSLNPMKDHPTFLHAASLLVKHRHDVRFVCVGNGPPAYRQQLVQLGESLGVGPYITWAGDHHDMQAVYNAFDSATLTSYGESFPNVIGEAMACGVVCVATDVGDIATIIADTGV